MTMEEILAGESKNVEFKESLPEKSIKYMKSVVAFANGTGLLIRPEKLANRQLSRIFLYRRLMVRLLLW